jgi:hypothetical protein
MDNQPRGGVIDKIEERKEGESYCRREGKTVVVYKKRKTTEKKNKRTKKGIPKDSSSDGRSACYSKYFL